MKKFEDLYSVAEYFKVPESASIEQLINKMINDGIESEVHLGDYEEFQSLNSRVSSELSELSIEYVEDNINKIDFLYEEDYKELLETANELFKYLEE